MAAVRLPLLLAALAVFGGIIPAIAANKQENLCLTCPRPEPACWMVVYSWQDYNLKGGFGTMVVVTGGAAPTEAEKARAKADLLRTLAPTTTVTITKNSRISCPPGARVGP
ncbi:MAG: hypothetical protein Q7R40_11935 [Phaeospirillum sp.]|nr:hypothetical protein [Phaeospirillum sp.]